jgi:hypothetical protein
VEVRGGYNFEVEEPFAGGGVNMPISNIWDFNPNFEWVFVEDADYLTINIDFHADLNDRGYGPAIWLGAGPALLLFEDDTLPDFEPEDNEEMDFGLNLFAGIGAKRGPIRPFGQVKLMLSEDNETSLAFGLRF